MKIKRFCLSFLMILSMFCIVACKDKKGDDTTPPAVTKQDSVVNASIDSTITRFAGDKLSTVELVLGAGSTDGVLAWDDGEQELELGTHSYSWNFTPTDSTNYNAKAGTISIYARVPLEVPEVTNVNIVSGQEIYVDSLLKFVQLDSNFSSVVDGTIAWENPNQVLREGDNTCTWVFTPVDGDVYAKVKGTVIVTASEEQYLSSISVNNNTKKSGYVAYDTFDYSGLTLDFNYNAGKVVPVEASSLECSIGYVNGSELRKGDTYITLYYGLKSCVVEIEEVGYKVIEKPAFVDTIVYDGFENVFSVATSKYYTFDSLSGINAGEYDLVLTLTDVDNLRWADSETEETIVKCYILEADHEVTTTEFTGVYDGNSHSSTVGGSNVDLVYYSTTELNKDNYLDASTDAVGFVNAGSYLVYYYAVGSVNYIDKTGTINVNIQKQTPIVNLEYLYTLKTNSAVNYPVEYVTVNSQQGEEIPKGELRFTYYERYSPTATTELPNIKTQPIVSGSSTIGGAPVNSRENVYYVVVEYLGDGQNYSASQGYIEFYIDNEDTSFYANAGTDAFAFKEHKEGDIVISNQFSITGTNTAECSSYLEFKKETINSKGLIEVSFISKFDGIEKSGKLIYQGNAYALFFNEDKRVISLSTNVEPETDEINNITVKFFDVPERTLSRWFIPKFLKTFSAKTLSDDVYNNESYDKGKNLGQDTVFTFYNDCGTIRFSANVNTEFYAIYEDAGYGGYERWAGVVTVNIEVVGTKTCFTLTCSIMTEDDENQTSEQLKSTGFSTSGKQIKFYWPVSSYNPTEVTLHSNSSKLQDETYSGLAVVYENL